MYVEDEKLYGLVSHQKILEGGNLAITFEDTDSTPSIGIKHFKFVQTKMLGELGISVNPKGIIIISKDAMEKFSNNEIDPDMIAVQVCYDGVYYAAGLDTILDGTVEYFTETPNGELIGDTITLNPKLPPMTMGDAGTVPMVNDEGTGFTYGKELPNIESGDAGKVLKVNNAEDGVEWGVGRETDYAYRITNNGQIYILAYNDGAVPPVYVGGTNCSAFNVYDVRKIIYVDNNLKKVFDLAYYDDDHNEIVYICGDDTDHTRKRFIRFTWESGHSRYESFSIGAFSNVPTYTGTTGGQVLKVKSDVSGLEWGNAVTLYNHSVSISSSFHTYNGFINIISTSNEAIDTFAKLYTIINSRSSGYKRITVNMEATSNTSHDYYYMIYRTYAGILNNQETIYLGAERFDLIPITYNDSTYYVKTVNNGTGYNLKFDATDGYTISDSVTPID